MNKCPQCNSKSGRHTNPNIQYCFACGWRVKNKSLLELSERAKNLIRDVEVNLEELVDCVDYEESKIPLNYYKWLNNYDFSEQLIGYTSIFWSSKLNRLCFPYYDKDIMVGCWARSLNEYPKWKFFGHNKYFVWYLNNLLCLDRKRLSELNVICFVEDVVSALKVWKFVDVICLGGTNIKRPEYKEIVKNYEKVIVFTDGDRAGKEAAQKIRKELNLIRPCVIMRNTKDPKCYSYEELQKMLKKIIC